MTESASGVTSDLASREVAEHAARKAADLLASGRLFQTEQTAIRGLGALLSCARVDQGRVADLRLLLASCYFLTRRHAEAIAQADQVLDATGVPPPLRARATLARLRALLALGDAEAVWCDAERILGGQAPGAEDALVGAALVAAAVTAWDAGRPTEALSLLRAARTRARRGAVGDSYDHPDLYLVAMLTSLGEFEEAGRILSEARASARWAGDATLVSWTHVHASRLAVAAGQFDAAVGHARAALAFSAEVGASYYDALISSVLATVACAVGDTGEAQRVADACRARGAPDISVLGWAANAWMEVDLAESQGGPAAALEVLAPSLARPVWRYRLLLERPHGAAWWVRAALSSGHTQAAAIVALSIEQLEAANPRTPSIAGSCAHARGVYTGETGTVDRAVSLYRHPWSRAAAQEDGALLAVRARRDDARQRLQQARRTYADCGGRHAVARLDRRTKDLASRPRSAVGAPQLCVWESLTDSEQRVAVAVAEGMTNVQAAAKLCLSRYTVDFHLRQIFRKLGIGSRVELARLVAIEDRAVVKLFTPAAAMPPGQRRLSSVESRGGECA